MCPLRLDLSDPDAFAFCPSCGAGYRAGITHCSTCQRKLISRTEIEQKAPPDRSDIDEAGGMKKIYSTTRPLVAHMLIHALQEQKIAAQMEGEHASKNFGLPVTIWVPEGQYAEAERVISGIEERPPDPQADVRDEAEDSQRPRVATRSGSGFFGGLLLGVLLGYGVFELQQWLQQWTSSEQELPTSSDRNGDGIEDGWIKYSLVNNEPIITYDMNFDGSPDRWDHHENNVAIRVEIDRNGDGKADWWGFSNSMGQMVREEQDHDFSGEADYWIDYESDSPRDFTEDRDFDGRVDSWGSFENGLTKEWNLSFRNDRVADKRIFYERNRRVRVEYDRDRDGRFEDVRHLTEFEEVASAIGGEEPPHPVRPPNGPGR